jgi:hypothetical protein
LNPAVPSIIDSQAEEKNSQIAMAEIRRKWQQENPVTTLPEIRWSRVVFISLLLIVLNSGWITYSEMKTTVTEITTSLPFLGVIFILFILTLLNNAILIISNSYIFALRSQEMRYIYTILIFSSIVAGFGHYGLLFPFLMAPYRNGESGNFASLLPLLPSSIGPNLPTVVSDFFTGQRSFFDSEIFFAWLSPLLFWGLFTFFLLATSLCLAGFVRHQWADEERLPFPAVTLPLAMTEERPVLYKTRIFWLGFSLPALLHSLNTLNSLYPALPSLPINKALDIAPLLPFPYSGVDFLPLLLHPLGIGIGYMVNSDVGFSLWFFYLLRKFLSVWGVSMGWRQPGHGAWGEGPTPEFPFTGFQAWGAWLALGILSLWGLRRHLKKTYLVSHSKRNSVLICGFTIGFIILCLLSWKTSAPFWLPPVFFGIYFLLMLALARLSSETATLSPLLVWVDPQSILVGLIGSSSLGTNSLVHLGALSWFNLDYRAAPTAHLLQGIVLCHKSVTSGDLPSQGAVSSSQPTGLFRVLLLTGIVAIVSTSLWCGTMYYAEGAGTANVNSFRVQYAATPWARTSGFLQQSTSLSHLTSGWIGAIIGFIITCFLTLLRLKFAGFPISPAAYVLNTSWAHDLFWCDLFVAWAIKALILRYGGIKAYLKALPLFLGLILGDFSTGALWSIIGSLLNIELYRTFPN